MTKRAEIEQLIKETGGKALTAEHVVERAKDGNRFPELHDYLWRPDVNELAAEARLQRAHGLLISLKVTVGEGVTTRLMMHTRDVKGYQTYQRVIADKDLAQQKLEQFIADIGRARAKVKVFRSLLSDDVVDAIDLALEKAEKVARIEVNRRESRRNRDDDRPSP